MTTQTATLTIETISTKPERDPYTNIDGIMSKTTLKLDPRDRTVWVTQEYNDNATPSDEWNGLILTWGVPSHPTETAMRQWITESMGVLITICDGFESRWNGSNHVGSLSEEARAAKEAIEFEFDNDGGPTNYYETWDVEAWLESSMNEITATTTDEQLADLAEQWQPDASTIVIGDILSYITQHRDNLKWDADQEVDEE